MAEIEAAPENNISKRILVLGSAPHTKQVRAYLWNDLPEALNVADFDVVILNLCPLQDLQFAREIDISKLPKRLDFARLLFSHESELIIIGVPGISFGNNPYVNVSDWMPPIFPDLTYKRGEEIRGIDPDFDYYFKHVDRWFFHTVPGLKTFHYAIDEYLSSIHIYANNLLINLRPIAETRFQQAIAFQANYQIVRDIPNRLPHKSADQVMLKASGNLIWLPPTTKIHLNEAIDLILQERYSLSFKTVLPMWLKTYKLPHQIPIENEIGRREEELQRLAEELIAIQGNLQEESRFLKLLYEGDDELELIVRSALKELGAQVNEPLNRSGDDGRLTLPDGRTGILEIKGLTGSLALKHVRQLDQWVRDAIANEDLHSKGILIANLHRYDQPDARSELFPDNCIRTATQFGQCLITTTQIFYALCAHQRNELDVTAFWDAVFNTNGVFSLPGLEAIKD